MDIDAQKRAAAARAIEFVRPGMRLGLGTGSTAQAFRRAAGRARARRPRRRSAVPTSDATRRDAERLGVPLTTLDETPELDLTVDGADEIAPDLSLIKGGGGALLREKIVAAASARMIVIADESKWVPALGRFPLPVEVEPFGLAATRRAVEAACAAAGCAGPGAAAADQGRPRFRHGWRALDSRRRAAADRRSEGAGGAAVRHPGRRRARLVHRACDRRYSRRQRGRPRRRAAVKASIDSRGVSPCSPGSTSPTLRPERCAPRCLRSR